jgi:hypothetical protein
MDRYDALGKRPERYSAFTEGLFAEAEDAELQAIANDAAWRTFDANRLSDARVGANTIL